MRILLGKLLFLIIGTCFLLLSSYSNFSFLLILFCLVNSCLNSIFDSKYLIILNTITYLILSFFYPMLIYFLPLLLYDAMFTKEWLIGFGALILLYHGNSISHLFLLAFLSILAIITAYQLKKVIMLEEQIIRIKDTSKEYELILLQRNQDIIEKRDNEIIVARLNERNRIARDIHDSVGHSLSSSILQLGAIQAINHQDNLNDGLLTLKTTLDQGMNSIRDSIHGLYADSFLLEYEVKKIIREFRFSAIQFSYRIKNEPPNEIKMTFILILKEALNNIIRHSNAKNVEVTFLETPGYYQFIIHDDGTTNQALLSLGIGLSSIEERTLNLKGLFNIQTENGYRIYVSVPKEAI